MTQAARRHTADTITDDELDQLYGWLDTARAVARAEQRRAERAEAVIRSALPVLKHAIDCLDVTCRYHGDQLDPDHHGQRYGREACCDTGVEPRRAREARQTLDRLRAALDEHQKRPAADEQLVHVGWWCWRGNQHGHLTTSPCRSDNVPLHAPTEWADDMRAVIQRIEDGDDEEEQEEP